MEIKEDIKETQRKLSKVNSHFFEFVEKNPDALKASSFKMLDLNDELFVLQPWPTFVNKATLEEFKKTGTILFDLIKSIPKRMFGNDVNELSKYYEIPIEVARLQLEGVTEEHTRDLVGRGDFLVSSSGLKCLEYNVSANLGGWYVPLWEALSLNTAIISKFLKEYSVKILNGNLIRRLLEHILGAISQTISGDSEEKNVVFVIRNFFDRGNLGAYLNTYYKMALQKGNRNLAGEIFICDYHQLNIVDKNVYFKGKKIHGMVEMYNGVISPEVMQVFKAGNIRLWNGPITDLLSSKLNLALLSDYRAMDHRFNPEEKKIIDTYIPWSRKLIPGYTTYSTENIKLENFVLSKKDRLVIKASIGYGGKSVYVGPKTTALEWEKIVEKALNQKNWVVQEFVDSLPGLYQAGENGCELHDMAWGFFILGSRYAGAWIRVIPQKENKGTINCHQGAKVSIIFEVDE